jgi:transcriptional regulator with XRE-family HTH domain
MQQFIGAYIRKLRREQNMTQSELGGTAFSKSYVSAVESNKLVPSKEALKHFALGLGMPEDYFWSMAQQVDTETWSALPEISSALRPEALSTFVSTRIALLEPLFEQPDSLELKALEKNFSLAEDMQALLTLPDQAHYAFFRALLARAKKDYAGAIEALEQALGCETHALHTMRILYEMSKCYLQLSLPQIALIYITRARRVALQEASSPGDTSLLFGIELDGGYISLLLGMYQQALTCFEQAQSYLNARQPMGLVGRLYWGLGYSTYALAYQRAYAGSVAREEIERLYQRGLTYLLQSRNIAQMSGDLREERGRRLTLALVQLDWSAWRWRHIPQEERQERQNGVLFQASISGLLDDASEQCRQVLAGFQEQVESSAEDRHEQNESMWVALALLIRISIQRTLLAHRQGYESTFRRERAFASSLCQQALEACADPALLETIAWNVGKLTDVSTALSFTDTPHLPQWPSVLEKHAQAVERGHAEVYFAAGEAAQLLGRTSDSPDFIRICYASADRYLLRALNDFKVTQKQSQFDGGYLARFYQRYTFLIEDRLNEETIQAQDVAQMACSLLTLCKQQMQGMQEPRLPSC